MLVLSTDSLHGYGLNRIFDIAKNAGYLGIDLVYDPKQFDTQNPDYINSLIKDYSIPVVAIQAPSNGSADILKKVVQLAKEISCMVVLVQPPKILNFKYINWLRREVPKLRQKENISIALENAPAGTFLGILPEHAMAGILELKKFKHACIDTSRASQRKEDIIWLYKILKPFIVHVHLSNVYKGKGYYLPYKGILPLESFLTKLKQHNFPGNISLKVSPKYLNAGNDKKVIEELKKCKEFYDEYFINAKISDPQV
jgi:sugar phosphate isomerase/epimerase